MKMLGQKFQKCCPKCWFFMVMNPMVHSAKKHLKNKNKETNSQFAPENAPKLLQKEMSSTLTIGNFQGLYLLLVSLREG